MNDSADTNTSPGDNTTLTEVLALYAAGGFPGVFSVTEDGLVECGTCGVKAHADAVPMHSLRRLEGASDPDDMLAVVAVTCPSAAVGEPSPPCSVLWHPPRRQRYCRLFVIAVTTTWHHRTRPPTRQQIARLVDYRSGLTTHDGDSNRNRRDVNEATTPWPARLPTSLTLQDTWDEPPSVNDVDPVALTIATLKLGDSHCANRHGEAKKNTAGQCEHALIDEHRLNDCEAQDHSEHHEEDNKQ
jgi:hypothetical protein